MRFEDKANNTMLTIIVLAAMVAGYTVAELRELALVLALLGVALLWTTKI